ncbi:MAG TPA: ATP-binding protein [Rhodocyclaceae bacterium]
MGSHGETAGQGNAEESFGIDAGELERRKAYLDLGAADGELLRALAPRAEAMREAYLDHFYSEMDRFEQTRKVLARSKMPREELRKIHGDQLMQLLQGRYELDYAQSRIRIGVAHQKAGLQPEWYVGAYRHLFDDLLGAAWDQAAGEKSAFMATAQALIKVVLLDIELAINAYFAADHEKLRLFAKVFESDLEAVLIADTRGRIQHVSHMVESISGYTVKDLAGHSVGLLHSPRNRLNFDDIWEEVTLDGSWHGNIWHRHANGGDYLARTSIAAVKDDEGRTTHYVIEYSDATESWQSEQALKARTEELARSNRELEQFAYVASHDLQEPLRMVASYTQLLARRYKGKLDADADEFIAFAVDGATRMQGLINDLLKLSRVGTRGKPFAPTACEKVLDAALSNLEIALRESGARVEREAMPSVIGDETQLIQLFQNLIGNGLKFCRPGVAPEITISAKRIGRGWEFAVRDNGIGISPEYFERIFIIFQRLHAKSEYPGTGIGLALCKKIVERHGGRIWVESRPNEGAAFHFTVPDREAGSDGL